MANANKFINSFTCCCVAKILRTVVASGNDCSTAPRRRSHNIRLHVQPSTRQVPRLLPDRPRSVLRHAATDLHCTVRAHRSHAAESSTASCVQSLTAFHCRRRHSEGDQRWSQLRRWLSCPHHHRHQFQRAGTAVKVCCGIVMDMPAQLK